MDIELTVDAIDIDGLTYNYIKNGIQLRRQVAREILSNTGVWADVAFLHQDIDLNTDEWKPSKITIARFKKINGIWKKQNHFNINSTQRADQIFNLLSKWRNEIGVSCEIML